jgi:hypothetical protein
VLKESVEREKILSDERESRKSVENDRKI